MLVNAWGMLDARECVGHAGPIAGCSWMLAACWMLVDAACGVLQCRHACCLIAPRCLSAPHSS